MLKREQSKSASSASLDQGRRLSWEKTASHRRSSTSRAQSQALLQRTPSTAQRITSPTAPSQSAQQRTRKTSFQIRRTPHMPRTPQMLPRCLWIRDQRQSTTRPKSELCFRTSKATEEVAVAIDPAKAQRLDASLVAWRSPTPTRIVAMVPLAMVPLAMAPLAMIDGAAIATHPPPSPRGPKATPPHREAVALTRVLGGSAHIGTT